MTNYISPVRWVHDAEGHGVVVVYLHSIYLCIFWVQTRFITYQMSITSTSNVFLFQMRASDVINANLSDSVC